MFTYETGPLACVRLGDMERWHSAVRVCSHLTPLVEEHPMQRTLVLALGGSERLLLGKTQAAGEEIEEIEEIPAALGEVWPCLGAALVRRLADAGLAPDGLAVGVGPTRTLAWLATAAWGTAMPSVVLPGRERVLLDPLPVAALQQVPDAVGLATLADIVAALDEAGIQTLGQLQRLTAEALARRFGAAGAQLAVLAAGGDLRPLCPRIAETWLGARLVFEPPLAIQHLTVALGPLAERLALTLAERKLAAGKLALVLESETGKRLQVERRLAHPLSTTGALLGAAERLLSGLLADATPAAIPAAMPDVELPEENERYITLRLRLGGLHPATAEQQRLWAREQQQAGAERIERLAAALRALQGGKYADALLRAEMYEPDAVLPEERYRLTPRPR